MNKQNNIVIFEEIPIIYVNHIIINTTYAHT